MIKEEIEFNQNDTQNILGIGLRIILHMTRSIFKNDKNNTLKWDINCSLLYQIINGFNDDEKEKFWDLFNQNWADDYPESKLKEWKEIFINKYEIEIGKINPKMIIYPLNCDDELGLDDFVYGVDDSEV